jgi:hypothetical protein
MKLKCEFDRLPSNSCKTRRQANKRKPAIRSDLVIVMREVELRGERKDADSLCVCVCVAGELKVKNNKNQSLKSKRIDRISSVMKGECFVTGKVVMNESSASQSQEKHKSRTKEVGKHPQKNENNNIITLQYNVINTNKRKIVFRENRRCEAIVALLFVSIMKWVHKSFRNGNRTVETGANRPKVVLGAQFGLVESRSNGLMMHSNSITIVLLMNELIETKTRERESERDKDEAFEQNMLIPPFPKWDDCNFRKWLRFLFYCFFLFVRQFWHWMKSQRIVGLTLIKP